ncbi:hypothetical protein BJV77DRAFT_1069140 [Russula vinacea]|nr:hypothetical protein BJV77DRAFT_1069140 [Russula vinacea]
MDSDSNWCCRQSGVHTSLTRTPLGVVANSPQNRVPVQLDSRLLIFSHHSSDSLERNTTVCATAPPPTNNPVTTTFIVTTSLIEKRKKSPFPVFPISAPAPAARTDEFELQIHGAIRLPAPPVAPAISLLPNNQMPTPQPWTMPGL